MQFSKVLFVKLFMQNLYVTLIVPAPSPSNVSGYIHVHAWKSCQAVAEHVAKVGVHTLQPSSVGSLNSLSNLFSGAPEDYCSGHGQPVTDIFTREEVCDCDVGFFGDTCSQGQCSYWLVRMAYKLQMKQCIA